MHPTPPGGNADNSETKGLAGKAIRKTMKTKGRQKTKARGTENSGELRRFAPLMFFKQSFDLLDCKEVGCFAAT